MLSVMQLSQINHFLHPAFRDMLEYLRPDVTNSQLILPMRFIHFVSKRLKSNEGNNLAQSANLSTNQISQSRTPRFDPKYSIFRIESSKIENVESESNLVK